MASYGGDARAFLTSSIRLFIILREEVKIRFENVYDERFPRDLVLMFPPASVLFVSTHRSTRSFSALTRDKNK